MEHIQIRHQINQLTREHRELDTAIQQIQEDAYADQLQLRRMKKRKLRLKDEIAKLESNLIPDIEA